MSGYYWLLSTHSIFPFLYQPNGSLSPMSYLQHILVSLKSALTGSSNCNWIPVVFKLWLVVLWLFEIMRDMPPPKKKVIYDQVSKLWLLQSCPGCLPLWLTTGALQDAPTYLLHLSCYLSTGLWLAPNWPLSHSMEPKARQHKLPVHGELLELVDWGLLLIQSSRDLQDPPCFFACFRAQQHSTYLSAFSREAPGQSDMMWCCAQLSYKDYLMATSCYLQAGTITVSWACRAPLFKEAPLYGEGCAGKEALLLQMQGMYGRDASGCKIQSNSSTRATR